MSEANFTSYDGTKLYLNKETSSNDKAVCVVVHGLCEHQGRYDYLADKFHKAGIGTYRFDHRGHGRSEGERTFYNDFNEMLDDVNAFVDLAIKENPDKPVFLLGHSLGGFAVALYGAKYPDKKIKGIVTSGALTFDNGGMTSQLPEGLDVHGTMPNELGSGVCSVQEVVDWYGKDPYNTMTITYGLFYAVKAGLNWFDPAKFNYPVIIMHGEKDGLVSVQDSYELFAKVGSKDRQLKVYGGLFHEIFNEYCHDETIGDAINWIENRI